MVNIKTEKQYNAACKRIEELLKLVGNDTPTDDKNFIELDLLSDLVADYEEANYPIEEPISEPMLSMTRNFNQKIGRSTTVILGV